MRSLALALAWLGLAAGEKLLRLPTDYSVTVAPRAKVEVNVTFVVIDLTAISDRDRFFSVNILQANKWFDERYFLASTIFN